MHYYHLQINSQKKAASPIEIIAAPGKAKATGKPEANAPIIIITSKAKNKCSMI